MAKDYLKGTYFSNFGSLKSTETHFSEQRITARRGISAISAR